MPDSALLGGLNSHCRLSITAVHQPIRSDEPSHQGGRFIPENFAPELYNFIGVSSGLLGHLEPLKAVSNAHWALRAPSTTLQNVWRWFQRHAHFYFKNEYDFKRLNYLRPAIKLFCERLVEIGGSKVRASSDMIVIGRDRGALVCLDCREERLIAGRDLEGMDVVLFVDGHDDRPGLPRHHFLVATLTARRLSGCVAAAEIIVLIEF